MKKILFLKIETNGLPKCKVKQVKNDNLNYWPNVISIYYKIGTYNKETKKIDIEYSYYSIVKTDFIINKYAQRVHQITDEMMNDDGKDIKEILNQLNEDIDKNSIEFIIGHNINFDYNIIHSEFLKNEIEFNNKNIKLIDTISYKHDYEYPKLEDLFKKLYGRKFKKSHPRKSLINITIKCFEKLY
tara:strand:+ start:2835 stop:3392 length:558 start_codon:yes stop_codon:yes gene_type:complete